MNIKIWKNISIPVAAILMVLVTGCFSVRNNDQFQYLKADRETYQQLLQDSVDNYLIDVRTKGEYNKSHLMNATNYSFLAFHYKKDVRHLNRNKLVFVYCQTCHRSPLAARKMKKMGFRKVIDLKGGYAKWKS